MYAKKSQNLQHFLWLRESNWKETGRRHPIPQNLVSYDRNFYRCITPCLSVQNVDKPLCFFRKFTPDGSKLLAFSYDQRSLEIYQYQGVSNAASLLKNQTGEMVTAKDQEYDSLVIRQQLFSTMFKKKITVHIVMDPLTSKHVLNREFSLFMENGRYVLLVSVAGGSIFPSYESYEEYPDMYDEAELYDYTFHLIDLKRGCVADSVVKPHDYIVLSHNHSISLYGGTLAIMSTYRQCIDVLELDPSGKLTSLYTVGPYGSALDRACIREHARMCNTVVDHRHSQPLSHLKQKMLAYMYREASQGPPTIERRRHLTKVFYKCFGMLENMLLLKMQLVDSDHLLLRYEKRIPQLRPQLSAEIDSIIKKYSKIYVFYNMTEQKVVRIFGKHSTNLLDVLRDFCDEFRNVRSLQVPWNPSSPSNNVFFRATFDGALNSFSGGLHDAAARINPTLPISAQSFSTSPYLDYSLFNYDDRCISTLERPRPHWVEPLQFIDRNSGHVKFRVHLESPGERRQEYEMIHSRNLVTYIFHPYEPFYISTQRFISRFCMNFHLYNSKTIVPKSDDMDSV